MKTIYLFLIFFAATAISATAQTSLTGKVTDLDTGEELIGANVVVYKDGVYVKGASTDFDGNYLMNLDPGTYDVEFSYIGYPSHKVSQVMVKAGQVNRLNIQFTGPLIELDCVMVTAYKVPLMHKDNSCSAGTITSEQIRNLPTKDISGLASSTAGLSTTDSGADVHVRGSRVAASEYYVDGIRVRQPDGSHPQPLAYSPRQQAWLGGGTPAAFADPDDFPDVFSGIIHLLFY